MKFRTERPEEVIMSMLLPQCRSQRNSGEQTQTPKKRGQGIPGIGFGASETVSVSVCVWTGGGACSSW